MQPLEKSFFKSKSQSKNLISGFQPAVFRVFLFRIQFFLEFVRAGEGDGAESTPKRDALIPHPALMAPSRVRPLAQLYELPGGPGSIVGR